MADKTPATISVSSGAEAFLAQIKALGTMRYLFANTGTDHGPLIEALATRKQDESSDIQLIVVPHEMAAVSMAHGYYNVTHQPQMVLVHSLPGTANALGGILNAASCNVPLLLVAGRTPITEGELRGGKSNTIHWRQESRDQGAIVREFVKWDYEVRTDRHLYRRGRIARLQDRYERTSRSGVPDPATRVALRSDGVDRGTIR